MKADGPGAVGAGKAENLTRRNGEVEPVERDFAVIGLGKPFSLEKRLTSAHHDLVIAMLTNRPRAVALTKS